MLDMFLQGGYAMYPLLVLSIMMVAISIERLMYLRRVRTDVGTFMAKINEFFSRNALQEALEYCEHTNSPIARIIKAGLKNQRRGRGDVIRAIEDEGALEVAKLEKGILTITTISKIAPMVGLFGTVTGMISSFKAMGGSGGGNPQMVAQGISEALVATAAGLIVGIPAYFLASYFMGRVSTFLLDMQSSSIQFLDAMSDLEEKIAERTERLDAIGGDYLEI